jgi:hypothetical protein
MANSLLSQCLGSPFTLAVHAIDSRKERLKLLHVRVFCARILLTSGRIAKSSTFARNALSIKPQHTLANVFVPTLKPSNRPFNLARASGSHKAPEKRQCRSHKLLPVTAAIVDWLHMEDTAFRPFTFGIETAGNEPARQGTGWREVIAGDEDKRICRPAVVLIAPQYTALKLARCKHTLKMIRPLHSIGIVEKDASPASEKTGDDNLQHFIFVFRPSPNGGARSCYRSDALRKVRFARPRHRRHERKSRSLIQQRSHDAGEYCRNKHTA